jgi:hypothetical protein
MTAIRMQTLAKPLLTRDNRQEGARTCTLNGIWTRDRSVRASPFGLVDFWFVRVIWSRFSDLASATQTTITKNIWKNYILFLAISVSSVWLQAGWPGFDPRQGQRIFPLASVSRPALRPTQPPVQWVTGSIPEGNAQPGRDADHSPPSSTEVKNE